ncbi:acyltransferase [Wenzhouxiangella sediminis]|uniref:Acyltransferase n=1 Tax=Wenzhouxiangella sediminis TaxID=1792836 RepID=A0A3E1KBG9_9GAMM|nr:acyltransferase [Wenzhouxiangella sediminis]RFF31923.1 acyltransferase [Wenzhouxiangella sediminis]
MIDKLIASLRIFAAGLLLAANSVAHILPLLVVALVKLVLRVPAVTGGCDRALAAIAASWIDFNSWLFDHLTSTRIEVEGLPEADMNGQMLVVCNHQSWVDIPVLQKLFNRRLPLLRFFLKSQLIWVPLLGLAWWALDFPFMKRYTRAQIERKPQLAGRDITATRRACRKFKHIPVAIVNFVEGTRFTPAKHAAQRSPYRHLLKPRAGGVAFTLDAMGDALDTLVDVSIAYPDRRPSLADLFANRVREIRVRIRRLPIPERLRGGDYQKDPEYRRGIQEWVNQLWKEKDATLETLSADAA